MTRQEIYSKIKEMNLQEEILKITGRNYTQVSTPILVQVINKQEKLREEADVSKNVLEEACLAFLKVLKDNHKLAGLLSKL